MIICKNLQAEFWEVPIQARTARSPGGGENWRVLFVHCDFPSSEVLGTCTASERPSIYLAAGVVQNAANITGGGELTSVKMLEVLAMNFKKREKSLLPQSSEHLITPQLQLAARTGPGTQQLLEIRSTSCLSRDFQHISAHCGTGHMLSPQHPAAQPLLSPLLTHLHCSMGKLHQSRAEETADRIKRAALRCAAWPQHLFPWLCRSCGSALLAHQPSFLLAACSGTA